MSRTSRLSGRLNRYDSSASGRDVDRPLVRRDLRACSGRPADGCADRRALRAARHRTDDAADDCAAADVLPGLLVDAEVGIAVAARPDHGSVTDSRSIMNAGLKPRAAFCPTA